MTEKIVVKKRFLTLIYLLLFISVPAACSNHQAHQSEVPQHRFDDIAVWEARFEDPGREEWQKPAEVVAALQLKPGDAVADIGAGTGYFTRHFARSVGPRGKAIGLDIEQSMVDYMKQDAQRLHLENYHARVVKKDDPELTPASFDLVFLCNTYHHIENRASYFEKIRKAIKKDGRLVIVDFYNKPCPVCPPPVHTLAKKVVIQELDRAGYRPIATHEFLPYQYILEFALK